MTPPAVRWFAKGLLACLKNDVDLEVDVIKLTLHSSAYIPDTDTDDFYNDATGELATADGYTVGGVTLSGKTLTYDAATDQLLFAFDDPTWAFTATQTWRYGVLRKARGGASSADELLALLDWGVNESADDDYSIEISPILIVAVEREGWWPTTDDIATILRARTKPSDGQEYLGVFNATTRPTATQVEALIALAAAQINAAFAAGAVPAGSWEAAKQAAIPRTAFLIEESYFPEEVDEAGATGTVISLRLQADAAMKMLVNGANTRALFSEAA